MSQFPRYESYKDSGVQWLGGIPSHWAMKKLKFLTTYFKGFAFKSEDFSDIGIPLIKASNIKRFSIEKIDTYIALDKIQSSFDRVKLQEGDLILSTVGSLPNVLNSAVGQIAYIENSFNNSYLNQNNVCFRCNDLVVHAFLKYFVMSSFFRRSLDSHALWIANQAYLEIIDIQNINVAFPPINEQKVIANFLDKRLGQIDELIAKQEELLKKLAEQRIALISHAVTKGLDPNVEMKDSGVEWLGKIPKHWGVFNIKKAFDIYNGATPKTSELNYWDGDIVWLTPADFGKTNYFDVNDSKRKITLEGLGSCGTTLVPKDSVILSTRAPIGSIAIAKTELCTNQGCKSMVPKGNVLSLYLAYYLLAYNEILQLLGQGTTFLELSSGSLSFVALPQLTLSEQKRIVDFIEKEESSINHVASTISNTIDKLKEYRSTLITQVVTGKIDVRNIDVN